MSKTMTVKDAELRLDQLKNGKILPKEVPILANSMYAKAYDSFMKYGSTCNTLREGADGEGGYLVPDTFENRIVKALTEKNVMRRLGTVIQTERTMTFPVAKGIGPADWIPEEGVIPTTAGEFDEVKIEAHKVATSIRVSDELLEDSTFDLDGFIADQFSQRIGDAEEEAFLYGNGLAKPLGLIYQLDREVITEKTGEISTDDLLELKHAILPKYRKNAVFLMHDTTLRELFKLRTGNDQYIWYENLKKNHPLAIFGHRVITSPSMPSVDSGKLPILFGDFKHFVIGDRNHRRIKRLTEVHAQQGQVAYIMSQRVDAKLLDRNAVAALKVK